MNDHDSGSRPLPEPAPGTGGVDPTADVVPDVAPDAEAADEADHATSGAGTGDDTASPPDAPPPDAPTAGTTAGTTPAGDTGADDTAPASGDEDALRRLLRDIVEDIEPSAASLEHLRAAVPARARRRKQLLVGATASVAVLAIGLVMVVSAVADVTGRNGETTIDAGLPPSTEGDPGAENGDGALGSYPSGGPAAGAAGSPESGADAGEPSGGGDEETAETSPDPGDAMGAASPTCDRGQLGGVETMMDPPDAQGRVYGLIRMANVSDRPCQVTGNGEMAALPLGAVPSADVQIVDRTEGDRATRLPTPAQTHEQLVLPPGQAYEVRFAFVPNDTGVGSCEVEAEPAAGEGEGTPPETGADSGGTSVDSLAADSEGDLAAADDSGTGGEAPVGSDDESGGTTEGGGGDAGEPTGEPTDDPTGDSGGGGTEPDDVVLLRYTPAAGEPEAAEIRLEGDCSGTIYRTGVLEAPAG
ncbi:hypothetical protein [Streptomyces sp. NBC_01803]|uniref:hypothetical protein n=1 Tax=Streptomyces sp. NBC_01803 TaxID=2975946 RepID=UPI002DDA42ED|nr:hypothetical protein [Streptomyces sp. NBC_01803]WSA45466.1 hypothetical protein OIE51_15425 [Streptomyces sp. NBC_01803]